ncbi:MAG: hypothetical protein JWO88_3872, partial [Frankiales bacterium]|nr:hypothetical protein [Frankiales bacterium]
MLKRNVLFEAIALQDANSMLLLNVALLCD